jgi:hydrogenase nickel insertion protein HypA
MHELSIVGAIAAKVVNAAEQNGIGSVASVQLTIGDLRDLSETWVTRYFRQCTRGTAAQDAVLEITHVPILVACSVCGGETLIARNELPKLDKLRCMACSSSEVAILSGLELRIESICAV